MAHTDVAGRTVSRQAAVVLLAGDVVLCPVWLSRWSGPTRPRAGDARNGPRDPCHGTAPRRGSLRILGRRAIDGVADLPRHRPSAGARRTPVALGDPGAPCCVSRPGGASVATRLVDPGSAGR